MDKNKYLGIGVALGLIFGAWAGLLISIIVNNVYFMLSLPMGAGFGMLVGTVVGTILDSQSKK